MKKEMLLDKYLSAYDFNEIHKVIIRASPEKAFAALKELKPAELSPLVYWLLSIRELPARLTGKPLPQTLGEETRLSSSSFLKVGSFLWRKRPARKSSLG